VPDDEVEHLRELAERYEEQLFTILAQKDGGQEDGANAKAGKEGGAGAFDPQAFEDEMDALAGPPKRKG
jgi:hypothetical protein